ncbi:hypothetical protein TNCV_3800551 [Trichonephila clavipes]|nr:hypothetical protein TNCV_3800551 [Trichonephila clavipes]
MIVYGVRPRRLDMGSGHGRGCRVVNVSDRGWPCHEFDPSTTKDPPYHDLIKIEPRTKPGPPPGRDPGIWPSWPMP